MSPSGTFPSQAPVGSLCVWVCVCILFHSQLDDVWMPEQLEVLDFSFDFANHIQTANLLPVQDLNSNLMPCQLVLSNCQARQTHVSAQMKSQLQHHHQEFPQTQLVKGRFEFKEIRLQDQRSVTSCFKLLTKQWETRFHCFSVKLPIPDFPAKTNTV